MFQTHYHESPSHLNQSTITGCGLKTKDIISSLRSLGINASEKIFKNPTQLEVIQLYKCLVQSLMDSEMENLPPNFQAHEIFEYPQLHEESVKFAAFYKQLQKILHAASLNGFSIRDLLLPNPQTMKASLGAIINFLNFREERLAAYTEMKYQWENREHELSEKRRQHQQVMAKLNEYREKQKQDEPKVKELERETTEMAKVLHQLNKKQLELKEENTILKQKAQQLIEKNKQSKMAEERLRQECEKLKSQIVHNPELLVKKIEDLGKETEEVKRIISTEEKKVFETQQQIEELTRLEKSVTKCLKILQECENEMNKHEQVLQEKKKIQDGIEEVKEMMLEAQNSENHLKRQIQSTEEKLLRMKKQQQQKQASHDQAIEDAKREKMLVNKRLESQQQKIERNYQIIMELNEHINNITKQHQEELLQMKAQFDKLDSLVHSYHEELFNAMKC